MPGKPRDHRPAQYISLPVDFTSYPKIRRIIGRFELEGYAFVVSICLRLANQKGFELEADKEVFEDIAEDMDMSYDRFKEILDYSIKKKFIQTYKFPDGLTYIRCYYLENVMLSRLIKRRETKLKYSRKDNDG